jgi:tetratricopeptide (TPR) repeat protein
MFLIVFAYLAEIYWWQIRKIQTIEDSGKKTKWLMISVFYTIFLTPGVIELVQTPFGVSFQSAAYQNLYVAELRPIPVNNFFVFDISSVKGFISSLQNLIVILTVISFLAGLWKRKLRISHAFLFIGALMLLLKHYRFTYEFTLLSIPILRSFMGSLAKKDRIPPRVFAVALPVVVLIVPLVVFHSEFANRPAYPFSQANLPTGIVRFLNQNASGGNILNEANTGGYLPWALSPGFKIFMDMQMTIFSDTDFATAQSAFSDVNAFKMFTQRYDPSFISVSLHRSGFNKIVSTESRFVPVFFDHAELLYVNKDKLADLARKYELKVINPFHYREMPYEELGEDVLNSTFSEAMRIYNQDPTNYSVNHILASILIVRKQYDQALSHAEMIIRHYPEQSHGYALKGDAFFGMERYAEAVCLYEKAMNMGQTSKIEKVYWNLHVAYVKLKKYKKAYVLLYKYVNPFSPNADYKDIYQLGMSAASVGKEKEAVKFLEIAKMKVPPADAEYGEKIEKNLLMLKSDLK